jgi:hypothetical protein
MPPVNMRAPRTVLTQPFGSVAPSARVDDHPGFAAFGWTYLLLRATPYTLVLLAVVFSYIAASVPSSISSWLGLFALGFLVLSAYAICAGVMSIRGMIAGVWMGMVEIGLNLLFSGVVVYMSEGQNLGGMGCGTAFSVVLLVLGFRAVGQDAEFKRNSAPEYVDPSPRQPGAVDYNKPYRAQGAAKPAAPVLTPRGATLKILALAASLEPDLVTARLERARGAAQKLLGDKYPDEIALELSEPTIVNDPHSRLAEIGPVIASNPKLVESVRKCVLFVLTENTALTLLGEQFLTNFDVATDGSVAG